MSPFSYVKLGAAVLVGFYIMSLRLDVAVLEGRIETYIANENALKDAVKTAAETQAFTAGVLT